MSNEPIHPRKARAIREGKYHYQKPGAFNNLSNMDREPIEPTQKPDKKASKAPKRLKNQRPMTSQQKSSRLKVITE